ncbi:MAG: DUF819 family protein [Saprospiraceae bacterium]|nr:DUF819 family protein [Saprospiraceae bacterium]
MFTTPLYVLSGLCLIIVLSEWLVRRTALRHLGVALLVILLAAIIANIGILPAGSTEARPVPTYEAIFAYVAPISIFWLLLRVNLKELLRAGLPLIILFLIGSLGTTFGVVLGMWAVNGQENVGELYHAVGGMFVGTYTGGSVNFNALALNYDMVKEGTLYGGSVVVDNIITTIWMIITLAIPSMLARFWPKAKKAAGAPEEQVSKEVDLGIEMDTESIHPMDFAITLALGMGALLVSNELAAWAKSAGTPVPSIIIITTIALIIAQFPVTQKLRGPQMLGMFSVYLFLAVIGAFCDLAALRGMGELGGVLLVFALITVFVHGVITLTAARVMKMGLEEAAMVSQANVGGGTSALALARSLGRSDLVLPAVLLGALGNAVGTFLGFWAAEQLLPMIS